ncbi:hypothetical protein BHU72_13410 [Desulfuribacillus stibiiarsenatis]|uniref:AraC effector-binding domain-containing protein n=1 Tax=Desulfuribacillus stibiiarsenatis TaxID=1390249 RepID=A0A1E5L8E8_9FIRM|nr:GyrI-like domain-containing protein [Desulfuribacillus stibiiarsenatis]OEH86411.1 hypothetical protein BHU72_13410 [Desulfuribacillus stibiiarsenatis]
MEYKVVEKSAFQVIGKERTITTVNGENLELITEFWADSAEDGTVEMLRGQAGSLGLLGICMNFDHAQSELTYMIAVEKPATEITGCFVEREISASTWVIFESVGAIPEAIQNLWEKIFAQWFPVEGYEPSSAPILEVYPIGNQKDAQYRCEAWVPVIQK